MPICKKRAVRENGGLLESLVLMNRNINMVRLAGQEQKAKHWCFTHNNYTEEDVERLRSLGDQVSYVLFGREVGDSGTPHLQGFISFFQRKRFSQVRAVLGVNAHLEVARDVDASITYCKKDGDFVESGTAPKGAGGRSDLDAFKDAVKSGMLNMQQLHEEHSEVCARYPQFVTKYVTYCAPIPELPLHELRPWQQNLNRKLNLDPDPRKIIFCVDVVGNTGKSWFAKYYTRNHEKCQILVPGKKADMVYALELGLRVFFLDCPRSKKDSIQYDMLEEIKNGMVLNSKYYSSVKTYGPCHVVVMMNEQPEMDKLSIDRYDLHVMEM